MEELIKLRDMLDNLLLEAENDLGGERVQPYIVILKGILSGLNLDISTDIE